MNDLANILQRVLNEEEGDGDWDNLIRYINDNIKIINNKITKFATEESVSLLLKSVISLTRWLGFASHQRYCTLFDLAQDVGINVTPADFYSPIPSTKELGERAWRLRYDQVRTYDFGIDEQLELLKSFSRWRSELEDIPEEEKEPGGFYWKNPMFGPLDASFYYYMIREFKPSTIIEVGSGYSTMLAARAAIMNGNTNLVCVEPFPSEALKRGFPSLTRLLKEPVQDVDLSEFESLQDGDFLFIDSTHVSKIDSDVNHLVFQVLPRLQKGVFIHIHDVPLPFDAGRNKILFLKQFWNEHYLVQAFLMHNNDYKIILMNHLLGREHTEAVVKALSGKPYFIGGGSIWIRKAVYQSQHSVSKLY